MMLFKQPQSHLVASMVFCCISAYLLLNYRFGPHSVLQVQRELPSSNETSSSQPTQHPKLVWLMSFPNSGTSYTLRQMEKLTGFSMATNYGSEGERSKLVYENVPEGPRCRGVSDSWYRPLPEDFVLVKTHCTGYATNEGADALKRDHKDFVKGCATTKFNAKDSVKGSYDTDLVHKAVHVIRDPFHNIISRFNCEHKLSAKVVSKKRALDFAEKYPKSSSGFQNFCRDLDADFDKQYSHEVFSDSIRREVKQTRCHDDVISYVQWHNQAFETCRELNLPTMVIHYEDYEENREEMFANLLDFMNLEQRGHADEFTARHDYQDYFTNEDRENIKNLVKQVASNQTWNALARYFD